MASDGFHTAPEQGSRGDDRHRVDAPVGRIKHEVRHKMLYVEFKTTRKDRTTLKKGKRQESEYC